MLVTHDASIAEKSAEVSEEHSPNSSLIDPSAKETAELSVTDWISVLPRNTVSAAITVS